MRQAEDKDAFLEAWGKLDPLATGALPKAAVAVPEVSEGAVGGVDLVTILLVLALALLCVEWGLYRTSRIP